MDYFLSPSPEVDKSAVSQTYPHKMHLFRKSDLLLLLLLFLK